MHRQLAYDASCLLCLAAWRSLAHVQHHGISPPAPAPFATHSLQPPVPSAACPGYALAVFIPISFACIFPLEMLRVGLVAGATAVSGIFILLNFRRPVFDHVGAKALPVYVVMAGAHAVLGLALYLFFFKYSDIQA